MIPLETNRFESSKTRKLEDTVDRLNCKNYRATWNSPAKVFCRWTERKKFIRANAKEEKSFRGNDVFTARKQVIDITRRN